jgi:hypothetical protein
MSSITWVAMMRSYGQDFCLTLLTNDLELAARAERAGVDRIGPDLERLGKQARQGGMNTWISDHSLADLTRLAAVIDRRRLFCRVNPIHPGSADEIEAVLATGAATVMLPMFTTVAEVETFLRLLDGRARPVLLLETAAAAAIIDDICRVPGVEEIHIGLNDLRLSLGWPSHFHVLVSDLLVSLSETIRRAGIAFRVGGIGRAGDDSLPIPSDLVYAQYPRLYATGALVSRVFFNAEPLDMAEEIGKLRRRLDKLAAESQASLERQREMLQSRVGSITHRN